MEFSIFHGISFQNGFPEFAHILQAEFLTVLFVSPSAPLRLRRIGRIGERNIEIRKRPPRPGPPKTDRPRSSEEEVRTER